MLSSMKVKITMARYNEKRITYQTQERLMDMLARVLAGLKTQKAMRDFMKDLLNRQERAMLARRLLIAEMLIEGATYSAICAKLRCGSATVARVERWLHFGRGGYERAIQTKRK